MDKERARATIKYYVDADLFIAMLKEDDELKPSATTIFTAAKEGKVEVFTSAATLLEILFWASKVKVKRAKIREYLRVVARLVSNVAPLGYENLIVAAEYLQTQPVFALDAIHAAAASTWPILSSDAIYEKLRLQRIEPIKFADDLKKNLV